MENISSTTSKSRIHNRRNLEFVIFFSLIFMLAIPFALVFWVLDVVRKKSLAVHGPFARAWSEANRVTPLIFSA